MNALYLYKRELNKRKNIMVLKCFNQFAGLFTGASKPSSTETNLPNRPTQTKVLADEPKKGSSTQKPDSFDYAKATKAVLADKTLTPQAKLEQLAELEEKMLAAAQPTTSNTPAAAANSGTRGDGYVTPSEALQINTKTDAQGMKLMQDLAKKVNDKGYIITNTDVEKLNQAITAGIIKDPSLLYYMIKEKAVDKDGKVTDSNFRNNHYNLDLLTSPSKAPQFKKIPLSPTALKDSNARYTKAVEHPETCTKDEDVRAWGTKIQKDMAQVKLAKLVTVNEKGLLVLPEGFAEAGFKVKITPDRTSKAYLALSIVDSNGKKVEGYSLSSIHESQLKLDKVPQDLIIRGEEAKPEIAEPAKKAEPAKSKGLKGKKKSTMRFHNLDRPKSHVVNIHSTSEAALEDTTLTLAA